MFRKACSTDQVTQGQGTVVQVGEVRVGVFLVEGKYYAIEDLCTHDDGPIAEGEVDGCQIECPRHGARFDVRTGAVLSMPAVTPIRSFATQVREGHVWVDVG